MDAPGEEELINELPRASVNGPQGTLLVATEAEPSGKPETVIWRVTLSHGTPAALARAGRLASLAFDGQHPYWSAFVGDAGGAIYRGAKVE